MKFSSRTLVAAFTLASVASAAGAVVQVTDPIAPLPSFARVTNPRSGQTVIVRINDRGPFHAGRIVDLSYAAAHRIGIAQGGSGEVELELLTPPFSTIASAPTVTPRRPAVPVAVIAQEQTPLPPTSQLPGQREYFVQLGAFGNFANAQVFQQHMGIELNDLPRIQQVDSLFRVRLGPYATREDAIVARDRAQSLLFTNLPITTRP